MADTVENAGKIFGKIRARMDETKTAADAATRPAPKPVPPDTSADRINPAAKYGDKPGEKRIDVSDMTKPLPSYKHGTDYVPKTGPAILHEGEKVTSAEDNVAEKKPKHNPSLYRAMHHLNKGGLHRALGVPEDQDIPKEKIEAAKNSSNEHVAHMANFAHTMGKFKK